MKKALTHIRAPRPARAPFVRPITLPARLGGGLALLALLALLGGLGLFASRPAHTAGGPIPVTVSNTVQNRDLDNPALQPFQFTLAPSSNSSNSATDSYTVPAGKRVVLEYYSAQLTQYPLGGYGYMYLITTGGGNAAYYKAVPAVASTVPLNQLTRIYADPGTTIQASVTQSSGSSCGGVVILSGYLVNVP